jgi:hypothetical protein
VRLRPADELPTPAFRITVSTLLVAAVVAADAVVFADVENGWMVPLLVALVGIALAVWTARARDRATLTLRAFLLLVALLIAQPIVFLLWASSGPFE